MASSSPTGAVGDLVRSLTPAAYRRVNGVAGGDGWRYEWLMSNRAGINTVYQNITTSIEDHDVDGKVIDHMDLQFCESWTVREPAEPDATARAALIPTPP